MKLLSLVNTKFWLVFHWCVHGSIFAVWRKIANGATELVSSEEWDNENPPNIKPYLTEGAA